MNQFSTSTSKPSRHTDPQLDQLRVVIGAFVLGFPHPKDGAADISEAYVMFLRSLPVWAVTEACERFAHKQVERKDEGYRPAVDLVYDLASDLVAKRIRDQEREQRLRLPPPPESHPADDPVMRARVLAEIEKWEAWRFSRADDRRNAPSSPQAEAARRREREAWNRSVEADGGDPYAGEIPVSPALERLVRG